MKYLSEEITVMKNGQIANAITEKESINEAISTCAMAMASALINENVATICVEAKDNLGGVYFHFDKDLSKE